VRLTAAATARLEWTVSIRDRRGELIRTLSHRGQSLSVAWNGTDGSGHPVPGGKYRAFVAGRDAVGHRALPAMLPMEVLGSRSSSVARPSGPRRTTRPKPDEVAAATGGFRVLDAVAGTGPDDVWAVGGTMTGPVRGHALVFHRSSAGWRQIPVPSPGTTASLLSVDSAAPGDVWAVGYRCARASCAGGGFGERSLIERGSNGSWQAVPSPNPDTGGDRLNAVAAISPTDAWAVGEAFDEGIYLHQPLLVHWNGARWTAANAPRIPGEDVNMSGLLALSPTDVWAVGHGCLGGRGCGGTPLIRPVVLHYDGVRWAVVSTVRLTAAGSSLQDIVGNGPADLTAAGWRARTRHGNSRPLGERRVNGRWRVGWAPAFGGILFGADTAPGAPVWTVGDRRSRGGFRTLAVRRTPGGWRAVASPTPRGRMSSLSSVAVLSRHDVWATGPSVSGPFLLHWNGARWSLVHPG
jgi:hypothetical protein